MLYISVLLRGIDESSIRVERNFSPPWWDSFEVSFLPSARICSIFQGEKEWTRFRSTLIYDPTVYRGLVSSFPPSLPLAVTAEFSKVRLHTTAVGGIFVNFFPALWPPLQNSSIFHRHGPTFRAHAHASARASKGKLRIGEKSIEIGKLKSFEIELEIVVNIPFSSPGDRNVNMRILILIRKVNRID